MVFLLFKEPVPLPRVRSGSVVDDALASIGLGGYPHPMLNPPQQHLDAPRRYYWILLLVEGFLLVVQLTPQCRNPGYDLIFTHCVIKFSLSCHKSLIQPVLEVPFHLSPSAGCVLPNSKFPGVKISLLCFEHDRCILGFATALKIGFVKLRKPFPLLETLFKYPFGPTCDEKPRINVVSLIPAVEDQRTQCL